ncbi:amino acid adenylation domain-containing protein [Metabacillus sp. Hm71]|uniref:amino acid adenylation domain-containing protein n=1 Tax=Metabacillus sp. Hm71 TaxID=3450743 RepID=UPI003F434C82
MEKIYPNKPLHNIGGIVLIKGNVNVVILKKAINEFIKANTGIRHCFLERDGEVYQYIADYQMFDVRQIECKGRQELDEWVNQEAQKPFSLHSSELFDFALFHLLDSNEGGYFVKVHHLLSDGWSMNLLTDQIGTIYMNLLMGEELIGQSGISYLSYLEKEQAYLRSDRFLKNRQFWQAKFHTLPSSFERVELDCSSGIRKTYYLSKSQSAKINQFAADHNVSVYAFFVGMYYAYLQKVKKQDDLIVGMPVLNRSGKKEKEIFGMFTSTMPFRHKVDLDLTVEDFMKGIHHDLMRCYFHQRYPFDLLMQDLQLKKKGYGDLFDTCINYYNTNLQTEVNGTPVENMEFYNGKQLYSLQLIIREWSGTGEFQLDIDYKVSNYEDKQIDHMYRCFVHLADQMHQNPNRKLAELELMPGEIRNKLLYDFNSTDADYPKSKTIYQLFEEQAERTPNRTALCMEDQTMTYRELNEKVNQLARYLRGKNVKRGKIVGISTKHSMETIIGMLGIMKTGAAYLPIDPDYPSERILYMLEDSGIELVLTNFDILNTWGMSLDKVEIVELTSADLYKGEAENLAPMSGPSDLAYMIYTSGSTGMPKGTMIEHSGLVNYICWAKKVYVGESEEEAFPFYSSLAFDLTVTSIFTPLISGNQIVIYPADNHEYVLYKIFKESKATIIKLTPSHLSLLQDLELKTCSIKTFIVGGEDLTVSLASSIQSQFGHDLKIFNEYGPTETVVGCMIHQFDPIRDTRASVPIGKPAQNTKIYLLDSDLNPVPVGVIGEIFVSGDGVSRGYRNKVELTRKRFISNPFSPGERMYRTGDLGKFIDEYSVEYVGRADDQRKIRGYRIEMGEIKNVMITHPSVKDAVVIDQKSENATTYICAYYVKKEEVSSAELFRFLEKFLPVYMLPSHFIPLKEIPLTINGKVDRHALPAPEAAVNEAVENGMEEVLIKTIGQVLQVENVTMKDNFYHLGGDSIKAIQITSKLAQKGFKIKTKDILANPVIEAMALHIETACKEMRKNRHCVGKVDKWPTASWFFAQNMENIHHYTQSVLLKVKGDLKKEILEDALQLLVSHHDSFRMNYQPKTEELYFNEKHILPKFELKSFDLSSFSEQDQLVYMAEIGELLKSSFNIEKDFLLKACVFELGRYGKRFLMTAHHLAVDGISWRIILEDLSQLYKQIEKQEPALLPVKGHSVQDWAIELKNFGAAITEKEKQYWGRINQQPVKGFNDFDLGPDKMEHCDTLVQKLSEAESLQLLQKANEAYRTKADELMVIALSMVLADYSKCSEVIIEAEGHGREEIADGMDVSRTVGWFTSLYPILLKVEKTDLSEQIKHLKDQLRTIPHKGLSYGVLKHITKEGGNDNQKLVRFNYLGDFNASFSTSLFEFTDEYSGRESSIKNEIDCLLEIVAYMVDNKLNVSITYSKNKFKRGTISQFFYDYINQLRELIQHCSKRNQTDFTPSDFETVNLSTEELESIFNS